MPQRNGLTYAVSCFNLQCSDSALSDNPKLIRTMNSKCTICMREWGKFLDKAPAPAATQHAAAYNDQLLKKISFVANCVLSYAALEAPESLSCTPRRSIMARLAMSLPPNVNSFSLEYSEKVTVVGRPRGPDNALQLPLDGKRKRAMENEAPVHLQPSKVVLKGTVDKRYDN